ncbi:MAG: hypothetical protein KAR11_05795 [Phycisphaerae bacterium]|nr:hypothetical protein [Phycisphaerae bacterium]
MGLAPPKPHRRDNALLLNILQDAVPLVRRPWDKIAKQLDWTQQRVLERVSDLADGGFIRDISGIFDAASLGYSIALVAFAAGDSQNSLDDTAAVVAAHPGVSHCYARQDDRYNLWFTLAVSAQSSLGLQRTVERLGAKANIEKHLTLPATRKFKLRVRFDFDGADPVTASPAEPAPQTSKAAGDVEITPQYQAAIRGLQMDLPRVDEPFAQLGAKVGLTAEQLLSCADELIATKKIRRYAAAVNHQNVAATTNVMVVWDVSNDHAEFAGTQATEFPSVTHCYLRPRAEDWGFTLYTMIQGQNRPDAESIIESISAKIKNPPRRELWTTAQYKKSRVKFFTDDEAAWENS